jgi:nicotinamide-nucleotide amidase
MQCIINQVHQLLIKKNATIAVAESCTGGMLSGLLTSMSGSSQYFALGVAAYRNKAKETILKIPHNLIANNGAVSYAVASLMAGQIRKIAKTDFGIGITGIAGPTGAVPGKPVGTVFIAVESKNKRICKKFRFRGNRAIIRKRAALKSLELLMRLMAKS